MVLKNTILLGIAGLFLGVLLIGQGNGIAQTKDKKLEVVPPSHSTPSSGKQMFKDYCAACHGIEGKGDGPAVEFLKVPPPDLTTMANRYNEKSVAQRVQGVLRFGPESKANAHGTIDMPLWGQAFRSLNPDNQAVAKLRIYNLSKYVDSMQQK